MKEMRDIEYLFFPLIENFYLYLIRVSKQLHNKSKIIALSSSIQVAFEHISCSANEMADSLT